MARRSSRCARHTSQPSSGSVRRSAGSRLTGDVARWIEDAAAEVSPPG
jgi:hypothetical protein